MPIPRLHLFELHEQSWFPERLRNGVTDGLYTIWKVMFWKNTIPHLRDLLRHSKEKTIVDLCSGAGGPVPLTIEGLEKEFHDLKIVLTDLYPNPKLSKYAGDEERLQYNPTPINAMSVPSELVGSRTLFESFHHFRPHEAKAILSNAVSAKVPIAIFEFQRREFFDSILPPIPFVLFVGSILSFKHTAFHWTKLLWTVIPIIPLVLAFDGLVSILRTYTSNELAEMAHAAGTDGFQWEVRQSSSRNMNRMTCLIGWPSEKGGVKIVDYPPLE